MKTRWFLRGLGIGIIISALFLCIGYREQSDHNELIKEAKKIGMVFPKEETTSVELAENLNNIQKQEVVSEAAVTTTAETEQEKNSREKIEKSKKDITSASTYQKDNKTVVVLPGETVQIKDNDIYINGNKIDDPYAKDEMVSAGDAQEPIKLGDDEYFVLGDHRSVSLDSRFSEEDDPKGPGPVKRENIAGKVFVRIWPLSKFGKP